MGNYHTYVIEEDLVGLDIPKIYFEDADSVESLFYFGYTQRKRWSFTEDISVFSRSHPEVLITVIETDEDETVLRKHQFLNGKHKFTDGSIVFPEIKWDN